MAVARLMSKLSVTDIDTSLVRYFNFFNIACNQHSLFRGPSQHNAL
jgi:hypothetical protein